MAESQTERGAGYLVKRVQQGLRRRCDAVLKPTGLSMAQYALLRALHDHPDASASELARLCFVTRQSLRDVLAGLRTLGLVDVLFAQAISHMVFKQKTTAREVAGIILLLAGAILIVWASPT